MAESTRTNVVIATDRPHAVIAVDDRDDNARNRRAQASYAYLLCTTSGTPWLGVLMTYHDNRLVTYINAYEETSDGGPHGLKALVPVAPTLSNAWYALEGVTKTARAAGLQSSVHILLVSITLTGHAK